jgi:hypothetical protein
VETENGRITSQSSGRASRAAHRGVGLTRATASRQGGRGAQARSPRARLAKTLLESLEALSEAENERIWADEAERRDAEWDATGRPGRPAADVLRDARAKFR